MISDEIREAFRLAIGKAEGGNKYNRRGTVWEKSHTTHYDCWVFIRQNYNRLESLTDDGRLVPSNEKADVEDKIIDLMNELAIYYLRLKKDNLI